MRVVPVCLPAMMSFLLDIILDKEINFNLKELCALRRALGLCPSSSCTMFRDGLLLSFFNKQYPSFVQEGVYNSLQGVKRAPLF